MVAGFRRSLSLSGGPSPGSLAGTHRDKAYHVRSTSLPCRSHPAAGHLEDEICSVRSLSAAPATPSAAWISDALDRTDRLHAALADLLLHKSGSCRGAAVTDRLLDDSLRLADAYASLRSCSAALRDHLAESRAAIRRRDPARLSSASRSLRREEKELARLASSFKDIARLLPPLPSFAPGEAKEVQVGGIVREAVAATAAASAVILAGVASMAASTTWAVVSTTTSKDSGAPWSLRRITTFQKKGSPEEEEEAETVALERLEEMQECLEELEKGGERVYRSLVNTRVTLLNVLTPSL